MGGIECLLLIPFLIHFTILDKGSRLIFYYLISSIVFAFGSIFIAHIWKNNMWFFSIMYIVQFIVLSLFFQSIIKNAFVKRLITFIVIPVFIVCVADFLKLEGMYAYNSYFASARTFILLVYGSIYFYQLLRDEQLVQKSIFINTLPNFWYNSGLFIYHCGSFMLFLSYNLLQPEKHATDPGTKNVTLTISYIAAIIQLILIYIGLVKAKKMHR
jgi:hypothetical protein